MFDFGFGKLFIICLVATLVLGPKQLPMLARTVGMLWGKASKFIQDAKAQLNQTAGLDEIQQLKNELENSFHQAHSTLKNEISQLENNFNTSLSNLETKADYATLPTSKISSDGVAHLHNPTSFMKATKTSHKANWRLKQATMPVKIRRQFHQQRLNTSVNKKMALRRKLVH